MVVKLKVRFNIFFSIPLKGYVWWLHGYLKTEHGMKLKEYLELMPMDNAISKKFSKTDKRMETF